MTYVVRQGRRWRGILAAVLAAVFFVPVPVGAGGTTSGLTGLVEVKTADVLPPESLRLSLYYNSQSSAFQPAVAFGIVPGLEVAVNGSTGGRGGDGTLGLGAKIGVLAETRDLPGLALGFTWGGVDSPSFFGTLSKRLSNLWRLHGGLTTGSDHPFFIGLSGLLNPVQAGGGFPPTTLLIEADGDSLLVGTRFNLAAGFDATLALRSLESFQVGVSYQTSF
ncbi:MULTISPECIES: hypothetical protein [Limnochorda]|uniref:hypothetical protein n=1 Tax=Limnochorda TaxID=1676651 RepID=UPI0026ED041F|nr:hypothetical protein [Limnochorda pilosa]